MKKSRFSYLNCNKYRKKFPEACRFSTDGDKIVYCTASSMCGIPRKRHG